MMKMILFPILSLVICAAGYSPIYGQRMNQLQSGEFELSNLGARNEYPYAIRFPDRPVESAAKGKSHPNWIGKEFVYDEGNVAYTFYIGSEKVINISGRMYADPQDALENIRVSTLKEIKANNGKMLEERSLPNFGFYHAWSYPHEGNTFYARSVTYLRMGNVYSAIVSASSGSLADSLRATQFLDSLQFPKPSAEEKLAMAKTPVPPLPKWRKFIGPDEDFSLLFPTKPERLRDGQGSATMIRHFLSASGSYSFSVLIQDFGGDPAARENNAFGPDHEKIIADDKKSSGARIVQMRRIAPNISESEYWDPNDEGTGYQHSFNRSILHRGRFYFLGCGRLIEDLEVDKKVCRMFFNSFKLLGRPR